MDSKIENVVLLYLLNQDTKALSLDELYALYLDTLNQAVESQKRYRDAHKQNTFSFD